MAEIIKGYAKTSIADIASAIQADLALLDPSYNVAQTEMVFGQNNSLNALVVYDNIVRPFVGPKGPPEPSTRAALHLKSLVLCSNVLVTPPIGNTPGLFVTLAQPPMGPYGIGICAAACRVQAIELHDHAVYAASWNILRPTDGFLLGGVSISRRTPLLETVITDEGNVRIDRKPFDEPLVSQEFFDWRPDFFTLNNGDVISGLVRVYTADNIEQDKGYKLRLYSFIFYYDLDASGKPI